MNNKKVISALGTVCAVILMMICVGHCNVGRNSKSEKTKLSYQAASPTNKPTTNILAPNLETNWDWTNKVPAEQRGWIIERVKKMQAIAEVINGSVVFHGLCLDQFGQPVAGAQVEVSYNQWSVPDMIVQSPTRKKAQFATDEHGDFWVRGINASSMSLAFIKDGYELAPHSPTSFTFAPRQTFSTNATTYHFWKRMGAAELTSFYNEGLIPVNGKSIWIAENLEHWSREELPNAIFKLTVIRERAVPTYDNRSPYRWSFELVPIGGQIKKTDDLFVYQAPESGYYPSIYIMHTSDELNWTGEQKIQFYFKTKSNKYGQGSLELWNRENKSEIYCELGLTWNPDGTRNLESKPQ